MDALIWPPKLRGHFFKYMLEGMAMIHAMSGIRFAAAFVFFTGAVMAHDPFIWNETTYDILLDGETSGGQLSIYTTETQKPSGPPLHIHDNATETFYVIEGTTKFIVDGEESIIETGGVAFVPAGAAHTFRVLDPSGGRQLVMLSPAGMEHFFSQMAAEGLEIPRDMERINEIATGFKLRFVGPPLPADE